MSFKATGKKKRGAYLLEAYSKGKCLTSGG